MDTASKELPILLECTTEESEYILENGSDVKSGILNVTNASEPGVDPGFGVRNSTFVTFQSLILYTKNPKI